MRGKSFNIAENPKYDEYLRGPASMVDRCFNKNLSYGAVRRADKYTIKSEIMTKQFLSDLVAQQ